MLCNSFYKVLIQDRSGLYFQKFTTASFCCLIAGMDSVCLITLWTVLIWGKKTQSLLVFV